MIKTNDMTRREKYLFGKGFCSERPKYPHHWVLRLVLIAKNGDITRRQFAKQRILRGFLPPPVCGINL